MDVDVQPIFSPWHTEDILGIVELIAAFEGECFVSDLDWDEDQVLAAFLERVDDPVIRADYESERAEGIQAAKDQALRDLQELIEARHYPMGDHSPFEWNFGQELLLKRKPVFAGAGLAYIWLSFFWLLRSPNHYLVPDPDEKPFLSSFDRVFEAACAFALAGRRESAIWYLGNCRNARELLTRLSRVTAFCGTGQPKTYQQLTRTQRRANDGGVDVLAVTTTHGAVTQDSELYLLGATIQKAGRRPKIIGANQVVRFRGYFLQPPSPPMTGVLAVPFDRSYLDAEECAEQNCLYLSKESFINYLGRHRYFTSHLRSAGRRIMKETRLFANSVNFRR